MPSLSRREPLLSDGAEPLSTPLAVVATVSLMVCGFTGISLPQALKFASTTVTDDDGDPAADRAWGIASVAWLLPIHVVSLAITLGVGYRRVVPRVLEAVAAAGRRDDVFEETKEERGALEGAAAPPPSSAYDPRFDTVKYFLTMMVAFCHFSEFLCENIHTGVWTDRVPQYAYLLLQELNVMPSYAFVSGYLSSPEPNARRLQSIWRSVGAAYFVNQAIGIALGMGGVGGAPLSTRNFATMMWYPTGREKRRQRERESTRARGALVRRAS